MYRARSARYLAFVANIFRFAECTASRMLRSPRCWGENTTCTMRRARPMLSEMYCSFAIYILLSLALIGPWSPAPAWFNSWPRFPNVILSQLLRAGRSLIDVQLTNTCVCMYKFLSNSQHSIICRSKQVREVKIGGYRWCSPRDDQQSTADISWKLNSPKYIFPWFPRANFICFLLYLYYDLQL